MGECYLCGNRKYETVSDTLRYGEKKSVKKCLACELVFIDPPMTKGEEERFYQEEYGKIFAKEKDTTPEKLFNARYPEAVAYYELVKSYISKQDKCLELGCASGYFLNYIKDKVSAITGYEPFIEFKRFCSSLGINMVEDLEECADGSFDKIFMFFLLEHLNDPVPYMKNLERVLKPGGAILAVVPNVEDVLLSIYNIPKLREFYFTVAHPFYYSKKTLAAMFDKAGFTGYEILPAQRYDLSNHMSWMMEGKPGGQGKYNNVIGKKTLNSYAEDLKRKFKCDTLFAVIKKR